jgi:hypothetical protein
MPFPLAHPAAVLPLRRFCPRYLSFPALVIGSVTPDVGYLFGRWDLDSFSHTALGSLGFGLPAGLLLLGLLYGLRAPAVRLLPERQRQAFEPLCRRPLGAPLVVVVSLLLGVWTHLMWDSFTHTHGWLVEHCWVLQAPVVSVGPFTVRVCHFLWYGCSFVGVAWLFVAFEDWRRNAATAAAPAQATGLAKWRGAVLVAGLALLAGAMHHLVGHAPGIGLTAASCLLLVIGVAWRAGEK